MIFHGNRLNLEHVGDVSARAALRTAIEQAGESVELGDLAAAAFLEAEPSLWKLLGEAVRAPATVDKIFVRAVEHLSHGQDGVGRIRTRDSFSPSALKALESFEAFEEVQHPHATGLHALLLCVLAQFNAVEQEQWSVIDVEAAQIILTAHLSGSEGGECRYGENHHSPLQGMLAAADDLTSYARTLGNSYRSPFEGGAAYDQLFDRLARALHRTSGHALLIGERGVGQNAALTELARLAVHGRLATLNNKRLLLVNCRHTPPERSRECLLSLLNSMADHDDLVICIDGFAALLRSERGATNSAMLLASLRGMQARLVGLLSPREYVELFAEDADLGEQFAAVETPEPEGALAVRLVTCYAAGLEEANLVQIEPEAIRQAVALTNDYILHERLPGKAVKVLCQICERIAYERAQYGHDLQTVTVDDVVQAVSSISGVPEETLRGVAEHGDYQESLAEEILGQEHAVREVADELGLIKAGLIDPGKPASVMLFVGQTGTGKTETAKALARFYSRSHRLRTYTLGNFAEPHSVASIIGVPPGYVGHEQGGRIVNDLMSDPYCVFLLDEADKAHPDVLQPFLNLFDEGWVCDQRGVKAYADKAIFILTTNVGQRMLGDMARQGKTAEEMVSRMKESLAQIRHGKSNRPVFAPEFLARIKRVVVFQPLGEEAMQGICRKLIRQMQSSWREKRQKDLVVSDSLLDWIATEAHQLNEKSQGREGGRLVRKLIADRIETPIQRAATAQPQAYRDCGAVVLEALQVGPDEDGRRQAPEVTVQFSDLDVAGSAEPKEVTHVGAAV